jgi:hypothetical protein
LRQKDYREQRSVFIDSASLPYQSIRKEKQAMPRKPNYDFERKERDRLKNLKKASRAEAKLKPTTDDAVPDTSDKAEPGRQE